MTDELLGWMLCAAAVAGLGTLAWHAGVDGCLWAAFAAVCAAAFVVGLAMLGWLPVLARWWARLWSVG